LHILQAKGTTKPRTCGLVPNDSRVNENDLDVARACCPRRRRSDKVKAKKEIMKKIARKLSADTGKSGKSTSKYKYHKLSPK
jgi:hypothetical protein